MRVGIVGGGIVGSAIAASIKKYSPTTKVSIIDDKRPNQTSQAGQGYLWSIHRCSSQTFHSQEEHADSGSGTDALLESTTPLSSLEYSMEAKERWIQLLGDVAANKLLEKRGSLLIAPPSSKEELLTYYDMTKDLLDSDSVTYLSDASSCNGVLLPSICGIHYEGDDYVTSPPALIDALMEIHDIIFEHRTVYDLEREKKKYDYVVCCTGPWISEIKNDIGVQPIRGVLLDISPGNDVPMRLNAKELNRCTPMMEFGYGNLGIHFTLSSRSGNWLLGASREEVSFSTDNIESVVDKLMRRSKEYLHDDILGEINSRKIGFRPFCIENKNAEEGSPPFQIKGESNVIFCYGFEGQGVLYAALAAEKVIAQLPLPS